MPHSPEPPSDGSDPAPFPMLRRGGRWWWVTALVSVLILLVMTWPWRPEADPASVWLSRSPPSLLGMFGCMALFLPFGFCEALLVRRILHWWSMATVAVAADAALLALVGETMQHWIPGRTSSLVDLVAAVTGGVAGALVAEWGVGGRGDGAHASEASGSGSETGSGSEKGGGS